MYLIYGSLLNQKLYKDIEISDSQKNKHWKNKFLYEKKNISQGWSNHFESSINQKPNNTMPVMFCMETTFVKKNSSLVARIVYVMLQACMNLLYVF